MDWLTFKFCVFIWVLCISKSKSESELLNSTTSLSNSTTGLSNQLRSPCIDGQPVAQSDGCNSCICFSGLVYCTNIPCPEKTCVNGMELPQPDECNKCLCQEGIVTCSNMICIPAPNCPDKQMYPAQNKCNACMCNKGFITCTSNVCPEEHNLTTTTVTTTTSTPTIKRPKKKKKKCVEGSHLPSSNDCLDCVCQNGRRRCKYVCKPIEESKIQEPECSPGQHLPRPDDCNNCICFERRIHCTHFPCRMDTRIGTECDPNQPTYQIDECNECHCIEGHLECSDLVCIRGSKCDEGEIIPKPDTCNTCKCVEGHILCTHHECPMEVTGKTLLPEIKGRLNEKATDLDTYHKKTPVPPYINILYTTNDKAPTKVIRAHAYNGYHQEIKVHASQLPEDTTKLLKVLTNVLDNAILASINQSLLLSNISAHKKPSDDHADQTKDGKNVLSDQSGKVIESGSLSNETISVIPHKDAFEDEDSTLVVPLGSKNETMWKSISAPAPLVNNVQQIESRISQQNKPTNYNYDKPSTMMAPNQNSFIHNPSKFGSLGRPPVMTSKLTWDTIGSPKINTQSINTPMYTKPIDIDDDKNTYAPFSQEMMQFEPTPSGSNRGEMSNIHPIPVIKPAVYHIPDYTTPVFKSAQHVVHSNNNDGVQRPLQSQFLPNPSKFYPNQLTQQQLRPKQIPELPINDKGVSLHPYFSNNLNSPIIPTNQKNHKPQHIGIKPRLGVVAPLNNIDKQSDSKFLPYPNNYQINGPLINLSNQKQRISSVNNEVSKEVPLHYQFQQNSFILNPLQNGFEPKPSYQKSPKLPNPSKYYKNEYEAPILIEVSPDEDEILQNSNSEVSNEKPRPKSHAKKYNTSHSHYEKHISVTYVPEYDSNDPTIVKHYPNDPNVPPKGDNDHYSSEEDSQKLNLKLDYYLNPSVQLVQNESHPELNKYYLGHRPNDRRNDTLKDYLSKTTKIYKYNPHSPSESKHTGILPNQNLLHEMNPINLANYQLKPSQPRIKEDLNDFEPASPKSEERLLTLSQNRPTQNQNTPGKIDVRVSSNGFEHKDSSSVQNPQNIPSKLETPQNHHLPGTFDERGSVKGFQYPSNLIQNPKVKLNKLSHYEPYKPNLSPQQSKNNLHMSPYSQFGPTQSQYKPKEFDNANEDPKHTSSYKKLSLYPSGPSYNLFNQSGSLERFRKPSDSTENPIQSRGLYKRPPSEMGASNKQHVPGIFNNPHNGFHYPSNPAENSLRPKDKLNQFPIKYGPILNESLQNPSNISENTLYPKGNNQNIPIPKLVSTQNQNPQRVSSDGPHFPFNSVNTPFHPNYNKPNNSQFKPRQKQTLPGVFDDRGSTNGFQNSSYSAENPVQPNGNNNNLPDLQFRPNQSKLLPWVIEDRELGNFPFNSANTPFHPNYNKLNKPNNSQFKPRQKQTLPGVFDNRGSTNGFQNPSNSAENPVQPNGNNNNLPDLQFGPNQSKRLPWVIEDRQLGNGFQYESNSAEDPKESTHQQAETPLGPTKNIFIPGVFDVRGSADGFQYPFNSAEKSVYLSGKINNLPGPQFGSTHNQHIPGVFDDHGYADGFQNPFLLVEKLSQPKNSYQNPSNLQMGPSKNRHTPGVFDDHDRGSANDYQYPSKSAVNPVYPNGNTNNLLHPQFSHNQNQHKPGVVNDRGSPAGFHYPFEDPLHLKQNTQMQPNSPFAPVQKQHLSGVFNDNRSDDELQYPYDSSEKSSQLKDNQQNPLHLQLGPNQNQNTPGVFNDRGSADGFQFPSNSAEDLTNLEVKTASAPLGHFQTNYLSGIFEPMYPKESQDSDYNDKTENQPTSNHHNSPLRPGMYLYHDQDKPASFDYLLNEVHNIIWSLLEDQKETTNIATSASEPKFETDNNYKVIPVPSAPAPSFQPDYDQYHPSSFDNSFNGFHHIPKPVANQDNNVLGPDVPNSDGDGKSLNYDDLLYPLYVALKSLIEPNNDNSGLSSIDQNDLIDIILLLDPGIADSMNDQSQTNNDTVPFEKIRQKVQGVFDKLKLKLNPENDKIIHNWLKTELIITEPMVKKDNGIYLPKIYELLSKLRSNIIKQFKENIPFNGTDPEHNDLNTTVTKKGISFLKLCTLLSKLWPNQLKQSTENIPFNGVDTEIIEKIMNDFKEDPLNATTYPNTDDTINGNDSRLNSDQLVLEETQDEKKYPEVHIIVHQPDDEDDVNLPTTTYIETDGDATDTSFKEPYASLFQNLFHPRYRHRRPKDQKEECGDGSQWISNCHDCSCNFGRPVCLKIPDCELRPFGQPMTCKPYSHFKMGCYTCECNGDGIAECDASDCETVSKKSKSSIERKDSKRGREPNGKHTISDSHELDFPLYQEFFNPKKTKEILQYYSFYQKLPKYCPKKNLESEYPTCERGTSWISSCHQCECNESGQHECTKIDHCVVDMDSYGKPGRCKPNTKFYPKTNSLPCVECSCNDEGVPYCPDVFTLRSTEPLT